MFSGVNTMYDLKFYLQNYFQHLCIHLKLLFCRHRNPLPIYRIFGNFHDGLIFALFLINFTSQNIEYAENIFSIDCCKKFFKSQKLIDAN